MDPLNVLLEVLFNSNSCFDLQKRLALEVSVGTFVGTAALGRPTRGARRFAIC